MWTIGIGTPIPLIQEQLGHERIEQTTAYARFHPDYSDIREYYRKVEERLGLNTEVWVPERKAGAHLPGSSLISPCLSKRRGWDSNPHTLARAGFQDRFLSQFGHPSNT